MPSRPSNNSAEEQRDAKDNALGQVGEPNDQRSISIRVDRESKVSVATEDKRNTSLNANSQVFEEKANEDE